MLLLCSPRHHGTQVGLAGYGKPTGYNRRQVWRWGGQYRASVVQVRRLGALVGV